MAQIQFTDLKAYVGFGERDAANLRALKAFASPAITGTVRHFYDVLLAHAGARSVLVGGRPQVERLKKVLQTWLQELFCGVYEDAYFQSRRRIGTTHVRVGLAQEYMPLAIEVIWTELSRQLRERGTPGIEDKLLSLHKLLILDLTIMLGSYHERYSEHVREVERRAVEGQLAQARHLAEIGQLAASLAHEVKNPLAGISGAIQVIGESLPGDSPYHQIIQAILAQISRLDATVKDLLLYARPSPPSRKTVKLGELVARTVNLLQEEPALRSVHTRVRGPNATVWADEGQLEQLVMNLILNAAQASPDGSTIDIDVRDGERGGLLVITDHGVGMQRDVLERAMEPFFTTKAKGTGLGLAICRRIVESHGGTICIESRPGKGTAVTVGLPGHADKAAAERA